MTVWTAWCNYGATGEGHSVMAWIGYAENELAARTTFATHFGAFFGSDCEAAQGVVRNEVTQYLFTNVVLTSCDAAEGKANIDVAARAHFNFS